MIEVEGRGELSNAPDEVFDLLADARNEERWHPRAKRIEKTTPGAIGSGTEFRCDYRGIGRMAVRITDYERPHRLGFAAEGRTLRMKIQFDLLPHDHGTAVAIHAQIEPRGVFRLTEPLLRPLMRHEFARRPKQLREALASQRVVP